MTALPFPAGPLAPLATRVVALSGWRRRGLAVALGLLAALALPPYGLLPALVPAFCGLVWLLDGARDRRAAYGAGWWFAFGWFSFGLYWIAHALLTDPARFGWMIPFAVFGLAGLLAFFVGFATLAARLWCPRGPGRVLALAACWTVIEWVRSWILTGFPWNPLGSVWDVWLPMLQGAALFGVFGLSLLTLLCAALPALLADSASRRGHALVIAAAVLPLAALWAGGAVRLAQAPDPDQAVVPGTRLRLVQAAVPQTQKWRDEVREANLRDHVALSRAPGFEHITAVVWPETAATYYLDLDARHRAEAAAAAPEGGLLLTGAPRVTPPGVKPLQVWNSLVAIDWQGRVRGVFDKVHLVPFGEYVPLRAILPIAKITHGGVDFSPGAGLQTLDITGLPPFSPTICYEDIFPAAVVGADQPRPDWLLNITNDGWFGLSAGPHQHLAAARLRGIEEGLPLARAANTGISAVADPYGRYLAMLPLGERGVVDSPLPLPLPPTPFARGGNLIPLCMALACLFAARIRRR